MPKVISKKSIGTHKVYDLDIDHLDSSFHVNSIPVHNCEICRELDGQNWKTIEEIPPVPFHWRCRCTVVPLTEYPDDSERAGYMYDEEGNKIPTSFGNINYKEWLKLQPKAVQDAINSKKYISQSELKRLILLGV